MDNILKKIVPDIFNDIKEVGNQILILNLSRAILHIINWVLLSKICGLDSVVLISLAKTIFGRIFYVIQQYQKGIASTQSKNRGTDLTTQALFVYVITCSISLVTVTIFNDLISDFLNIPDKYKMDSKFIVICVMICITYLLKTLYKYVYQLQVARDNPRNLSNKLIVIDIIESTMAFIVTLYTQNAVYYCLSAIIFWTIKVLYTYRGLKIQKLEFKLVKEIFIIGNPMALLCILYSISAFVKTSSININGVQFMKAFAIYDFYNSIIYEFKAFCSSFTLIVSSKYLGKNTIIKQVIRYNLILSILIAVVVSVSFYVANSFKFLTNDKIVSNYLWILGILLITSIIQSQVSTYESIFASYKKSRYSIICCLLFDFGLRSILMLINSDPMNIVLAFIISYSGSLIFMRICYRKVCVV